MQNFKMRRKAIFFFFLSALFLSFVAYSQDKTGINNKDERLQEGTITIRQDARISSIIERHIRQNKRKRGIDGYRIQLFFNSGPAAREQAIRLKADFLSSFPDYPVYILYQSPFYKVRIGDFRTKSNALKVFQEIKKKYPTAYIVKDIIKFPNID